MELFIRGSLEVAHQLPNYDGACANLHGHRFEYKVTFSGKIQKNGMVEDFKYLDTVVKATLGSYDHSYLNNYFPNPTLELFAEKALTELNDYYSLHRGNEACGKFTSLEIWETSKYGVKVVVN